MTIVNPEDDPGWPSAWSVLVSTIPYVSMLQMRRRRAGEHGILTIRRLFLSFATSIVWFGVVIAFLKLRRGSVLPWVPLLAVVAIASVVLSDKLEKPLDCAGLAGSYRTRFFLRLAFAQCVALFAFVCAFIGGGKWIFYAGAAFTLLRFWTNLAPTRAALARDQEQLNASGCGRSLIGAFGGPAGGATP